ncbi:MAG TPA: N-acetyl-gamma-glutamyl-phosphate reductase, partial [Actinomycetota bacterium]|nr:N-acetyl-gamma-glutamyl-phosphate reductase [Actinomycetota bacterium]
MTSIRNAGVLGASGYAGAELLRLLAGHPDLDVAWAAGEQAAGQPLVSRYPGLRAAYGELAFCTLDEGL